MKINYLDRAQDELRIISKLWEVCKGGKTQVEFVSPVSEAIHDDEKIGYSLQANLKKLQGKKVLSKLQIGYGDSEKVAFSAEVVIAILFDYISDFHDAYESHEGETFGFQQQKDNILQLIRQKYTRENEPLILTFSEKDLGEEYFFEYDMHYDNFDFLLCQYSYSRYKFMKAIRALEKDGKIQIVKSQTTFDLSAFPVHPDKVDDYIQGLKIQADHCIAPEHCKVALRVLEKTEIPHTQKLTFYPIVWSTDFKWNTDGKSYEVGDGKKLEFDAQKSTILDVFRAIVSSKEQGVSVTTLRKATQKDRNNMKSVIQNLRGKIRTQGLSDYISIETIPASESSPALFRAVPLKTNPKTTVSSGK